MSGDGDRTLPHNLDAERSVLGAILTHNDAYDAVAPILGDGRHFYRQAHRRIWDAIVRLAEDAKVGIDFVTLKEELNRVGEVDEVGGPAYLSELQAERGANVKYYAEIVREKGRLRDIIYASNQALSDAYAAEQTSDDILSASDTRMLEIHHNRAGRLRPMSATANALMNRIAYRLEHRGELQGLATGHPTLDELTVGLKPGELFVPGAWTSVGKTAFLLNLILASALTGTRWALFSFEMSREEVEDRLVAIISGIDAHQIRLGHVPGPHQGALSAAVEVVNTLPLHIDDRSRLTIQEIRTECRILLANEGINAVAIDYFQMMPGSLKRRDPSRPDELTDIAIRTKDLGKELGIPVTAVTQLNYTPGRPSIGDIKDSKAIGQSADIVGLLYRKKARESGRTELILAKQRNGPTGTVYYDFDRDTQRMTPTDGPSAQETTTEEAEAPKPRPRRPPGKYKKGSQGWMES